MSRIASAIIDGFATIAVITTLLFIGFIVGIFARGCL